MSYCYKYIGADTQSNYNAAWSKYLCIIQKRIFKDLRTKDFQAIINQCDKSKSTKEKIKALCTLLCKYGMELDLIDKNYGSLIRLEREVRKEKEVFTDKEIEIIKTRAKDNYEMRFILIMIYTGFRISEFLQIQKQDVNLEDKTITGGLKTNAGKNRIIPINDKIYCYVQGLVNDTKKDTDTIIHKDNGKSLPSKCFREKVYAPALEAAGIPYRVPHCTRHTFATLLDRAGVPGSIIQKLLGHTNMNLP